MTSERADVRPPRGALARSGDILLRLATAVAGGYLLAAALAAVMVQLLPLSRADAVDLAVTLSFVTYAVAVLWAFAASTALRAAFGVLAPGGLLALLALLLAGHSH